MNTTVPVEPTPEPAPGIPDLRAVPLFELAASASVTLRRIVPSPTRPHVAVATFQASI